ncbi:cyclic nucleotide-binding domain protein (macronuclear) [Tetrahymena thermophila SB210]|uniref:Cyclic nucleotide-binding domain protein n=1 Tax=Tetrahymena thermophila (strain SB210) TaxID=312017 RepID=I7MIY6_TETTS|nr:cyclic nucleotide-binding domain protein [Tetrahymena thermophila SB210]EAS04843.1 cyclic nucleotide-binding domain protein [Tetrahymena thermophila SB210]|eukprot:XP_001025088.1 cyclic nucleotide-binding domain protein [Tetrahymena thermophila SB210]
MAQKFIINDDVLEKAIKILENRSFIENKDSKQTLMNGLCQIDHFKTLMRDPSLCFYLYPYLEDFVQQVTYRPIPKGKILFHEGDNVNNLYFVMRGSFVEFQIKSEGDLEQEMYWEQQAGQYKQQLTQIQKNQLEVQEKKKMQLQEIQKIQASYQKQGQYGNDSARGETTTTIGQTATLNQIGQNQKSLKTLTVIQDDKTQQSKRSYRTKEQPRKSGSLEEIYFTDEFKQKQSKLQSMSSMYSEATRFYQGIEYEQLLKIENKYQERYFKNNKCLFKKTHTYSAGMSFGELHNFDTLPDGNLNSYRKTSSKSTVVCSENSFLLQISCKAYQRIFSKLTEKINFVFHVLANCFPSVKKVILNEFAFQFNEQTLEYNQHLFSEGEPCNYVYIMQGGEIDYRKQITIRGELVEKRIGMVNQGEIFGHEDIFQLSRQYSVYSCVNNSVVYRIKKEFLLISQFIQPLKSYVKQRQEYLSKRVQDIIQRNTDLIEQQEEQDKQKNQKQQQNFSIYSLDKTANSTHQIHSNSLRQLESKSHSKLNHQTNNHIHSLSHIPVNANLKSQKHTQNNQTENSAGLFQSAKNINLGENDYHLTFKSLTKLEILQSQSNTKTEDQSKNENTSQKENQQNQQNKKIKNAQLQTTRAQPESVYSRIIRPDSAFKEELDQMKKEQAAQLSQFNSSDIMSSGHLHDYTSSSKFLSLNKMYRGNQQQSQSEFKINKMPKDMFSLQIAINSDEKLKKKILIRTLKQEEENQYQSQNKLRSGSNSPVKKDLNSNEQQTFIQKIPRGTTSSLMRYKEQAKDYFVKDDKPKQLDFFMEFQNYRQEIKAKEIYDKLNKKEAKEDPFSHIDFNVVQNSVSTPQSQISNQSTSQQSNTNKLISNNLLPNTTKSINQTDKPKSSQFLNSLKANQSINLISKQKNFMNNNFFTSEEADYSPENRESIPPILNMYNSQSISSQSQSNLNQYNKNFSESQRSQSKDNMRRSQSNTQQSHRKIHFSNQNSINSYQKNTKISNFGAKFNDFKETKIQQFESAPIQVRSNFESQQNGISQNNQEIRPDKTQNKLFSAVYVQNQQAENDIRNNFQNSLSFVGLRNSNNLRLGQKLNQINARDKILKK